METTIIDRGNLPFYETLLLPEAAQMIRGGMPIFALGAAEKGVACGALAGGPWNGKFELLSFFVARERRDRGAATVLLDELVRIASLQETINEITCSFVCRTPEHERLAGFLKRKGFACLLDGGVLTGALALRASADAK